LLDAMRFDDLLGDDTVVVTGEGSADSQTLMGKLPFGILQRAEKMSVPVVLLAGRVNDKQQLMDAGFAHVACINPPELPLEKAVQPETARRNICKTIQSLIPTFD